MDMQMSIYVCMHICVQMGKYYTYLPVYISKNLEVPASEPKLSGCRRSQTQCAAGRFRGVRVTIGTESGRQGAGLEASLSARSCPVDVGPEANGWDVSVLHPQYTAPSC